MNTESMDVGNYGFVDLCMRFKNVVVLRVCLRFGFGNVAGCIYSLVGIG